MLLHLLTAEIDPSRMSLPRSKNVAFTAHQCGSSETGYYYTPYA
jgi:hypothetical protein